MDSLSLVASIAGLICLADAAVTKASKFCHSVKDAPIEMPELIGETAALSGVLSALKRILEQGNPTSSAIRSTPPIDSKQAYPALHQLACTNLQLRNTSDARDAVVTTKPVLLDACLETLQHVRNKVEGLECQPHNKSFANASQQLKWGFKGNELRVLAMRVERHKSSFQLAISVDSMSQLQQLLAGTGDIFESLESLKEQLQGDIQLVADQQKLDREQRMREEREMKNRKFLKFLSPIDFTANQEAASELQQEGTGRWFLDGQEFRDWMRQDRSFLWLHGITGAGKTILTSMVIDEIRNFCLSNEHKYAYAYCDFRNSDSQDPKYLIGSLVGQMAMQFSEMPKTIRKLDEESSDQRMGERKSSLSLRELFRALTSIVEDASSHCRTYVVIDALDECVRREELLSELAGINSKSTLRLNVLVTSRQEIDIKRAFNGLPTVSISENDVAHDVELYVKSELEKHPRLVKQPESVRERITLTLVAGARGMFRWVKCQLDVLCKARNLKAIDQALCTLPASLDETYERILLNIEETDFKPASRALRWLICSARPLTIEELAEAIFVDPGQGSMDFAARLTDPDDLFDICGTLITSTSGIVSLAHYSVKEFLISTRILSKGNNISRYAVIEVDTHRDIAEVCLTYLAFDDFDGRPPRNSAILRNLLKNYPLLAYASRHWSRHSRDGKLEPHGKWFTELFGPPGTTKLSCLIETLSYLDRGVQDGSEAYMYDDGREGPLSYVARCSLPSFAQRLLELGADVNARGGRCGTPLQAAVYAGLPLVRQFLERGADPNGSGGYLGNPLQLASSFGPLEVVELLIEHGANVDTEGGPFATALQVAALCGNGEVVQLLLEHGASVNTPGGYYGSALQAALRFGRKDIVQMLLDWGADPTQPSGGLDGYPVIAAARCGESDLVRILLDRGANPNVDTYWDLAHQPVTPLQASAAIGNEQAIRLLLKHGANVDAVAGCFGSPLAIAAQAGHLEIVELLMRAGSNVDGDHRGYWSPLQGAINGRQHAITLELLGRGADVNSCRTLGTPLTTAARIGSESLVRLLLEHGADVNSNGHDGSPLQTAAAHGNLSIVQLLLVHMADVNRHGGENGSAVTAAAVNGHDGIVQVLTEHGAVMTIPDCFGYTLAHWCAVGGIKVDKTYFSHCAEFEVKEAMEPNVQKLKETIKITIQRYKQQYLLNRNMHLLGKCLLYSGFDNEAAVSFEQEIRRLDRGRRVFDHKSPFCDMCEIDGRTISGPRYVCKVCSDYDLCEQCYCCLEGKHGVGSTKPHSFLKVPRECWYSLPDGIVDEDGRNLEQWLDMIEAQFQ